MRKRKEGEREEKKKKNKKDVKSPSSVLGRSTTSTILKSPSSALGRSTTTTIPISNEINKNMKIAKG